MMLDFLNENRDTRTMKKHLIFLSILMLTAFPTFSQEGSVKYADKKALGDKVFNLDLGIDLPVFYQPFQSESVALQLGLGGLLGLSVEGYLNNEIRVGGGVKLNFSSDPNGIYLFTLPFFAKGTYEFKFYPYRFTTGLELGAIMLAYGEDIKVDPFIAPTLGFSFVVDPKWTIGLNGKYWLIPQVYYGESKLDAHNGIANFAEISVGFSYNFY